MAYTLKIIDGRGVLFDETGHERGVEVKAPAKSEPKKAPAKSEPKKAPAKSEPSSK